MSKFLNAFLEFKNEDELTKRATLIALILITVSLAALSISGAWANSEAHGEIWQQALAFIPRFAYSVLVFGIEMLAAFLFVRALVAAHWSQAAVCFAMLFFLAWANVQNVKDGVHFIFPTRFAETGQTLRDRAVLAGERAGDEGVIRKVVADDVPKRIQEIRDELAELKLESKLMTSQTQIREAQERLVLLGMYPANRVDGIRADITLTAMAKRGEQISERMALLQTEQGMLNGSAPATPAPVKDGAPATDQTPKDQRDAKIEFEAAAREADAAGWRLEVILWVAEIARSLGLWAAVTSISGRQTNRLRKLAEDIEAARLQAELDKIQGAKVAEPEQVSEPPPATQPDPPPIAPSAPVVTPEPVAAELPTLDLTTPAAPIPGRAGGLATGHGKSAAKAKNERLILVGDWEARDAMETEAAKVAAQ